MLSIRTHGKIKLEDLKDPDERAFYQIVNELVGYREHLISKIDGTSADSAVVHEKLLHDKYREVGSLFILLVGSYLRQDNITLQLELAQKERKSFDWNIVNQIPYPAQNGLLRPHLESFMTRFTIGIRYLCQEQTPSTGEKVLKRRRFEDSFFRRLINNILDILSEWTGSRLGKVHGRVVVNNIKLFDKERVSAIQDVTPKESDRLLPWGKK